MDCFCFLLLKHFTCLLKASDSNKFFLPSWAALGLPRSEMWKTMTIISLRTHQTGEPTHPVPTPCQSLKCGRVHAWTHPPHTHTHTEKGITFILEKLRVHGQETMDTLLQKYHESTARTQRRVLILSDRVSRDFRTIWFYPSFYRKKLKPRES